MVLDAIACPSSGSIRRLLIVPQEKPRPTWYDASRPAGLCMLTAAGRAQSVSVADLLAHFFSEKTLELRCDECQSTEVVCRPRFDILADNLILHLKRFEADSSVRRIVSVLPRPGLICHAFPERDIRETQRSSSNQHPPRRFEIHCERVDIVVL